MTDDTGIDRTEGNCDGKCGPIAIEVADWKPGNPTGYYCDSCGYFFKWEGGYKP